MNHHRPLTYLLLAFGCAALAVLGFLGAASAAGAPASPGDTSLLQAVPARPMPANAPAPTGRLAAAQPVHQVDLGALYIPMSNSPDSGTVGSAGTWLSASPDVISTTTGLFGLVGSGFGASETLNIYANGTQLGGGPYTSDAAGFTQYLLFRAGSQEGYITLTVVGATSGKSATAAVQVLNNAPKVPGLAVAPHAITSGSAVHAVATGYPASTSITFALDGSVVSTPTTDANGAVAVSLTVSGSTGGAVVNTYRPGVAASMAGQGIEVRPDALAPASDMNVARAMVDRAVLTSTVASVIILSGEGFQAGETVTLSSCASDPLTADSNGSVGAFLATGAGAGIYNCVLTGGSSGRAAYAHIRAAAEARDAPSALVLPSNTTATGGTVKFAFNHLLANQGGTVYVDGQSQGAANTTGSGYGSVQVVKPGTTGGHSLIFIGASGQMAIAPLFVLPGPPTATPTHTATAGPSNTPTQTAIPTATSTATPVPSSTATPPVTETSVPGSTATATATTAPGSTATATTVPGSTATATAPSATATATPTTVPGSTATATPVPGSTATATTVPGSTVTATAPPATATATPCTASFTDVPPSYWAYPYIQWAACQGIVSGYADHTFRPDNNTTRGQLAKMVVLAAGFPLVSPPTPHFSDVPLGHPFYTYIETAYAHGVISGYADGTFRPGNDVTRGQLSKMVVLSQGIPVSTPATPTFLDVPAAYPFYGYIETAVAHNIVSGYTCGSPGEPCPGRYYRPNVSATRAQLSKMLYQATHPAQPQRRRPR